MKIKCKFNLQTRIKSVTIAIKPEIYIKKTQGFPSSFVNQKTLKDSVLSTIHLLRDKQSTVGFAESCTGGLLSSSFAQVPGVSDIFMGSFVTYANYTKADILKVRASTLETYGVVSAECAKEMSENALILMKVRYAVSITGIAGPQGGSLETPVGHVFIAISGISDAEENETSTLSTLIYHHDFSLLVNREDIQIAAAIMANQNLQEFINEQKNLKFLKSI